MCSVTHVGWNQSGIGLINCLVARRGVLFISRTVNGAGCAFEVACVGALSSLSMHFDLSIITKVTIQINSELAAAAESNHGLGERGTV